MQMLIVCLDDQNGMTFNHRRCSSDRRVTDLISLIAGANPLHIERYSKTLFESVRPSICPKLVIHDDIDDLLRSDPGILFVERSSCSGLSPDKIVVFRWRRSYPADMHFELNLSGYAKTEGKFHGNSHEEISVEIYEKMMK